MRERRVEEREEEKGGRPEYRDERGESGEEAESGREALGTVLGRPTMENEIIDFLGLQWRERPLLSRGLCPSS